MSHFSSIQRLQLTALAAPESHGLSVLLQLGNQCIALLYQIRILLVLVVRTVGLDDSIHTVHGAGYPLGGDEFCKIPVIVSMYKK